MSQKSHSPIEVQCNRLSLSVEITTGKGRKKTKEDKVILQDITASFKPGRLTAIMGSSGAGKTSLLTLLAGDAPQNAKLAGEVLISGCPTVGRKMKKISGFVFQDDVLFNTMTVKEALTMSATLRLPESISAQEKFNKVDEIISLLGLEKAKDTIIGTPDKKGISGGERKRTAIGMEMITDPMVLFLDEPTSGLDTFTAYSVVTQLKDLSRTGKTVVATIHQPSSKTFMLFDDLVLLAEGHVVYHGPVDEVLPYMEKLGFVCPTYMNPADFLFMEVLNESANDTTSDKSLEIKVVKDEKSDLKSKQNANLISSWLNSSGYAQLQEQVKETKSSAVNQSLGDILSQSMKTRASFGTQFCFLAKRVGKDMIRNKMMVMARLMKALFMGILMSSIYKGVDKKEGFAQMQDRINALFFICTNEFFSGTGNSVYLFSFERPVFLREYQNRFYSVFPYFLSKALLEIPLCIAAPLLTLSIFYPAVGFRPEWAAFFSILFSTQLISLTASSMGLMLGALFPDFSVAMSLLPALTLPMMIFSGVQLNMNSIPWYFRFMPYVSPLRWAFYGMAKTEFTDLTFPTCVPGMPCTGNDVLKLYGLDDGPTIIGSWLILLSMILAFSLAGLFFLWKAARK